MIDFYTEFLGALRANTAVWSAAGQMRAFGAVSLDDAIEYAVRSLRVTRSSERVKAILFGNGGSMTLADHFANDFNLCANWRSLALSNAANLSSVGNDIDFDSVFERQIEWLGRRGDVAIAISCSGESPNIVRGAIRAATMGMLVITLSACARDNALGTIGHMNFWVDTDDFGRAQAAHMVLLHAISDLGAHAYELETAT